MDKIKKALNILGIKERERIKEILIKITNNDLKDLDLKRLKKRKDIFRVRKGKFRIFFQKTKNSIKVLAIERRDSKTYKKK